MPGTVWVTVTYLVSSVSTAPFYTPVTANFSRVIMVLQQLLTAFRLVVKRMGSRVYLSASTYPY